jgi:hypothetical protein
MGLRSLCISVCDDVQLDKFFQRYSLAFILKKHECPRTVANQSLDTILLRLKLDSFYHNRNILL